MLGQAVLDPARFSEEDGAVAAATTLALLPPSTKGEAADKAAEKLDGNQVIAEVLQSCCSTAV